MAQALWVAKTGLDAQQTRLSVISNNLANVNTNGFKKDRVVFNDLLYQTIRQSGALSSQNTELPSGLTLGTGVRVTATEKIQSQGGIVQTDNPLDVAINGNGFFQVLLPDGGTAYTRDGAFQRDSQGQLVTSNGFPIQPAITIPPDTQTVSISQDGAISATLTGATAPTQIGNIQIADFINPTGLQPIGDNLFRETASSGAAQAGTPGVTGLGLLNQGSLENSNVNVVEELVNMIETQRAYEMNARAIETTDEILQFATNSL